MTQEHEPVPGERRRAAAVLGIFVLVLFAPALLDGRVLAPAGDGTLYYYPLRVHVSQQLVRGIAPLWNPSAFDGFPLLADSEAGVFYPPNLLFLVLPPPLAMNLVVLSSFWLAALFTFLYARAVGASFSGALLAGMAFGGGGFLVTRLAHTTIVNGAAGFPLLMWFVERLRERVTRRTIAGAAFAAALPVLAGHPQIAFYSWMSALVYLAYFTRQQPRGARAPYVAAAGAALGLGLLLAACQILPTAELARLSNRARLTYESFGDPSLPPSHLLLMLIPNAFGGPEAGPYWFAPLGWSLSEAAGYVGLVPLTLAFASLPLARTRPHVRFWLAYGLAAVVMALGQFSPLHRLLYFVPGYNLFRSPARNLMQVDFALAVLAGLAASRVGELRASVRRAALLVTGLTMAFAAWFAVVGNEWRPLLVETAPRALEAGPGATGTTRLTPIVLALAALLVLLRLARRDDRRARLLLGLVAAADLVLFGSLWQRPFALPTPADLGRPSSFLGLLARHGGDLRERFLSLNPADDEDFAPEQPNTSMLHQARSAGGNSSFILRRYGELIAWTDPAVGVDFMRVGNALDVLGVRHLFVSDRLLRPTPAMSVDGVGLSATDLRLALARERRDALDLPLPDVRCDNFAVEVTTRPERLPDGVPVLRLLATTANGQTVTAILRSGWPDVAWAGEPRSRPAREQVRAAWDLPGTTTLRGLRLETLGAADTLQVERVVLHDRATGHSLALGPAALPPTRLRPVPDRVEVAGGTLAASALEIVSALSGPTTLGQGQAIATVSVHTAEGPVLEHVLRAGVHTSEWAWERPDVRDKIQHRMAPVAASFPAPGGFVGHRYRGRLDLGRRSLIERVVITHVGPDSNLILDEVDAVDGSRREALTLPVESVELVPESAAPPGPARLELELPPLTATAVEVVGALHDGAGLGQGVPVATIAIRIEGGRTVERTLRAGEDVSEWAYDRPDLAGHVRHARAAVAESFPVAGAAYEGHRYRSRVDLGGESRVVALRIEPRAPVAGIEITRLRFLGPTGLSLPTPGLDQLLSADETRPAVALEAPPVPATELTIVSRLGRAADVEQGAPVLKVRAQSRDGSVAEFDLRAGEHTSEWRGGDEDVRARMRHRPAARPLIGAAGYPRGPWYVARMPLEGQTLRQIELVAQHPSAVVSVAALSLYDEETGRSTPISGVGAEIVRTGRWRRLLRTWGATAFENEKALPRAWLVPRVRVLPAEDVRAAVTRGRLPAGAAFEPRDAALVEEGTDLDFGARDPDAAVILARDEASRVTIETRSATPGFLVLTDAAYPGWTARVDGQPTPVVVTDFAFRGLPVPAGRHRVEFVFRPLSVAWGGAVSLVVLTGLLLCAPAPWRFVALAAPLAAGALALFSWPAAEAGRPDATPQAAGPAVSSRALDLARLGDAGPELGEGWWNAETWSEGRSGRWTQGDARLVLGRRPDERTLLVEMSLDHPAQRTSGRIEVNGKARYSIHGPNGPRTATIDLAADEATRLDVRFVIDSVFVPWLLRETGDLRELGVFVHGVRLVGPHVASPPPS